MKTNLTYLRDMSAGNKDLVREMIEIFISQVKEFTIGMDDLLAKKDYLQLGKLAHKAKSSISIMGLNDLAADLKTLENMTKEGKDNDLYKKIVENFKVETNNAIIELEEVKENLDLYF
ncbi:MAG: Hpt domain-containing protein [Bacteroidales bacterium]|nr:Hpt domain-containing protein [Bacteroidales bacterium]